MRELRVKFLYVQYLHANSDIQRISHTLRGKIESQTSRYVNAQLHNVK